MDLSSEVKQFAADNDREIKAVVQQMVMEFFESTIPENYHEKYDEGTKEHGEMTEEKLMETNWIGHLTKEIMDAYWYVTLSLYKERRGQE